MTVIFWWSAFQAGQWAASKQRGDRAVRVQRGRPVSRAGPRERWHEGRGGDGGHRVLWRRQEEPPPSLPASLFKSATPSSQPPPKCHHSRNTVGATGMLGGPWACQGCAQERGRGWVGVGVRTAVSGVRRKRSRRRPGLWGLPASHVRETPDSAPQVGIHMGWGAHSHTHSSLLLPVVMRSGCCCLDAQEASPGSCTPLYSSFIN